MWRKTEDHLQRIDSLHRLNAEPGFREPFQQRLQIEVVHPPERGTVYGAGEVGEAVTHHHRQGIRVELAKESLPVVDVLQHAKHGYDGGLAFWRQFVAVEIANQRVLAAAHDIA